MLKVLSKSDIEICIIQEKKYDLTKIANRKNLVLFSGGIDSQALTLFLKNNNIHVETLFAKYCIDGSKKNFFNKYDNLTAEQLQIDHKLYLDLDKLYMEKNITEEYFNLYRCTSPQFAVHLHIIDYAVKHFPDYNILLPSTPILWQDTYGHKLYNWISYDELVLYRYKESNNMVNLFPFFFLEFEVEKQIVKSNVHNMKNANMYTKKFLLYNDLGLPVIQQDNSWTGFKEYKIHFKEKYGKPYDTILRNNHKSSKKKMAVKHWAYGNSNVYG